MAVVGLLHPGAMGAFLGRALAAAGHEVRWAGAGRSAATRERASGFTDAGDLEALVAGVDTVLSICPPAAAVDVARSVGAVGFTGTYVDANAVAPATVRAVAAALPGCAVVDGAVIGGPRTGSAVLHLAGPGVVDVAALFDPATLTVRVLGQGLGAASALKACYALTTKAVTAARLTARAAAEAAGVGAELAAEWDRDEPGSAAALDAVAAGIGAKAWRFGPEMTEAAAALDALGAPAGFSAAAAEVYRRLADLQDRGRVDPAEVWVRLAAGSDPDAHSDPAADPATS